MGNNSSKRSAGGSAKEKSCGEPKETETQMDSIEIAAVELPFHGKLPNINFGMVNTVGEEIERLVYDYDLNVPVSDCQMILCKDDSGEITHTVMELDRLIEYYKDPLTSSNNYVRLVHNPQTSPNGQPNLSSLGVNFRN